MKPKLRKGFTLIELLISMTIVALLATVIISSSRFAISRVRTNEAITNMNTILTFIGIFREENRRLLEGTDNTSNSHFRELFAQGYLNAGSEILFYVPASSVCTQRPDEEIGGDGAPNALEAETCGFSYVDSLEGAINSGTPIMFDAHNEEGIFDENLHNGKVLVGTVSGQVTRAQADGASALTKSGIDLADLTNENLFGAQGINATILQPSL